MPDQPEEKKVDLEKVDTEIRRISDKLFPVDPETGMRIYNPDGAKVVSIDELLGGDDVPK